MTFKDTPLHAMKIRESADDGSDFSNPEADYRVLFLGEDGLLHVKDSAGSVTDPYDVAGGGGNPVVYDIERYTGGDIGVTSTTAGADMAGVADVVVAAAAGDLLMIGLSCRSESPAANSLRFDVKFITGATENYVSSEGTAPSTQGVSGWFFNASHASVAAGEVPYVVQAADIAAGNVTASLRAWLSGAGTYTIAADADAPLKFWVRNLGQ